MSKPFSAEVGIIYSEYASKKVGEDLWVVDAPFTYTVQRGKYAGALVSIPRGFLTDGASVPKVFWNIIPPWGIYGQAAIVHDTLCESLALALNGTAVPITRAVVDAILYEAMLALNTPVMKAKIIFYAVSAYRVLARVNKPNDVPGRAEAQAEIQEWYEQHGNFEPVPAVV